MDARRPRRAAQLLKHEGFVFDVAYTSVLKRAIRTLWIVLDGIDQMWLPVHRHWRLNERHYGALAGTEQGGDRGTARRGADEAVAAQLRHPPTGARAG